MHIELKTTMDPHSRSVYIDGKFYGNLLFHTDAKPRFSFAASGFDALDIEVMQAIIDEFNKLQKPYVVKVLWNTESEVATDDDEGNQHYEFRTKEEAKAFIEGIEESSFSIHDQHTARLFNRLGNEVNINS